MLFTGHLLSTSTFDLLVWTAVTWLAVRAVRTRRRPPVAGRRGRAGDRPAQQAAARVPGARPAGGRRDRRPAAPAVATPTSGRARRSRSCSGRRGSSGRPTTAGRRSTSRESIAAGGSTSSEPWWAIVPFQVLLVSPLLAPVWIAGLVAAVSRSRTCATFRFLAWAWVVLAVVFMATGGKPYYLAGLLPALIGAGAVAVDGWLERGRGRRACAGGARGRLVASAVGGADHRAARAPGRLRRPGDRGQRGRRRDDRLAGVRRDRRGRATRSCRTGRAVDPDRQLRRRRARSTATAPPSACLAPTAATTPTATGARRRTAPVPWW